MARKLFGSKNETTPDVAGTESSTIIDIGTPRSAPAATTWMPSDIWKIGDSGIQMSMTDTATLEQDDAPASASDTPSNATATQVNLWQTDSVGFKVTRRINFAKRRSGAVVYLANGEYGGVAS